MIAANSFSAGRMSNVLQLPKLKKTEDQPSVDSNGNVTIAIAHILASCSQLSHTIKELSKHFGAVDRTIMDLAMLNPKTGLIS